MKRHRAGRNRLLWLEGLEERNLMAVAQLAGTTLRITGDNTGENVTVTEISFRRLEVSGDGFDEPVEFFPVHSIWVDMKAGDDTIIIGTGGVDDDPRDPIELLGSVTIQLGKGSDTAGIYVNTIGNVTVNNINDPGTDSQDDTVFVGDSIMNKLSVTLGIGNDSLEIVDSAILTVDAKLGVNSLASGQVDSDSFVAQNSALGFVTITLGTADAGFTEETPSFAAEIIPGENNVGIHATLIGKLTITGGTAVDNVLIDSEGDGIGPNIQPHFVSLLDDIEDFLVSPPIRNTFQQVLDRVDAFLSQNLFPGTFELPEIILGETDLSDTLDEFLSQEVFDFIDEIGTDTIIISHVTITLLGAADTVVVGNIETGGVIVGGTAKIDTGAGDDKVFLTEVMVLGVFPPFTNPLRNPRLTVLLGAGDFDSLTIENVVCVSVKFDGGAGVEDSYTQLGDDNFLLFGSRTNFELF